MGTITREQLRARASEKVKSLEFAVTQTAFADSRAELEEELELARIALASLEAEPVAWRSLYYENHGLLTGSKNVLTSWQKQGWKCEPLYTAPPSPVVPEEATPENIEILASTYAPSGITYQWDRDECNAAADSWNACRAAMLQAGNGVSNGKPLTITLPDISSKAFWSGTGKNETFHPETYRRWVKEAIERSCTIARVDVEVK